MFYDRYEYPYCNLTYMEDSWDEVLVICPAFDQCCTQAEGSGWYHEVSQQFNAVGHVFLYAYRYKRWLTLSLGAAEDEGAFWAVLALGDVAAKLIFLPRVAVAIAFEVEVF